MKYCQRFCIYAALLIMMCGTWIKVGSAQTWMPDANLRTAVQTALGTLSLTQANLATLTTLEANAAGISDITGLEHATSLTELELDNNQIRNISALSSLTSLTRLYLDNNQIRNISALSSLTELTYFQIGHNRVNDISPLKGLTKLRWLYLHNNQIYSTDANIAALKSLTAIEHIAFDQPFVNDLPKLTAARNGDETALRALLVTPPPPPSPDTTDEPTAIVEEPVETPRRRIIYQCPVGWVRSTVFGNAKKAMIYELKVDIDLTNRVSLYTLKSIAIYVHPDEGLETLEGWYLATGILYNHDPENKFQLTAENSVIDEQGFAHIQNPDATPIRMGTLGFIGQSLPSFDYRLYDEKGMRVDFGISCYKEGGLTWRLWNTKDPRVVRMLPLVESEVGLQGMLKDLNWDSFFYRSEWTAAIMPDLPDAPFAPSKPKVNLVGTWADLKKQ